MRLLRGWSAVVTVVAARVEIGIVQKELSCWCIDNICHVRYDDA